MMKHHRMSSRSSNILNLLHDLMARVGALTFLRLPARVPIPVRGRPGWDTGRRRPSPLTVWLPLLAGIAFLAASPAMAASSTLQATIPNFADPGVQAHYQAVEVGALSGNPDFPAVLLVNTTGDQPQVLLLGLDARNGKDTWSLTEDPIILIMVFTDGATLQVMYVDVGFADQGKASGTFAAVDPANGATLPELLKAVAPGADRPV
ncbi:MAG TPA: hypothetical protein VMD08_14510 [Candidatus Baltobacteraceae bacterium]|nr:hypothetical protein [Candidatus Baltobacteraceae bacterium]